MGRKPRTTATKVTAELNQHLNSPVPTKIVRSEPNITGYHERAAIREPLLSTTNIQKKLKWCMDRKGTSEDQRKQEIFSDESNFSFFPTARRVYVWKRPREAYNSDCLLHTVKDGGRSVMV